MKIKYNLFIFYKSDFEQLAYDFLDYCYGDDQNNAKKLLLIESDMTCEQTNCFEIVISGFEINKKDDDEESKKFIAHQCFQDVVKNAWYGEHYGKNGSGEYYFCFIFCILFAPILLLLYFPYDVSI